MCYEAFSSSHRDGPRIRQERRQICPHFGGSERQNQTAHLLDDVLKEDQVRWMNFNVGSKLYVFQEKSAHAHRAKI